MSERIEKGSPKWLALVARIPGLRLIANAFSAIDTKHSNHQSEDSHAAAVRSEEPSSLDHSNP